MTTARTAIFLVNLLQDVNILRPLVYMAARDFRFRALILVSSKFYARDLFGIWQTELDQICAETGAVRESFSDDWEAHRHLQGSGLIFAASESNLSTHIMTHAVFRHAPASFLKVTLQHGFECVGFNHSADHVRAYGETATFGADIVCAWYDLDRLRAMALSQRGKLLVTGPTAVLQLRDDPLERDPNAPGIVCENLHSVRLNIAGDFKAEFVDAFAQFCGLLDREGRTTVLRPHPGGQYVLKKNVLVPTNAHINNAPIYKLDLRKFAYGISAPSSVLIDMLLAEIPTAVWRDREGTMDADNYAGLTTVSTPREWLEFSEEARARPAPFLERQRAFLERSGMPLDAREVFGNFARLFQAAERLELRPPSPSVEHERIQFVANADIPSLQLSFEKPLAPLVRRGAIATDLLTEQHLRAVPGLVKNADALQAWINRRLDAFGPSIIIFCRYSGPAYQTILAWARRRHVPVLYHIDDDLLAIPPDIGEKKFAFHNAPERLDTVRSLLNQADLVYASTEKLRARLLTYVPDAPLVAGRIYCSSSVMRRPVLRPARKVGYMGFDHALNLAMILPAIEQLLERNPHVTFELFGSIPMPPSLLRFGERVSTAPRINNYETFLSEFAKYEWDVGICPLTPIAFNMLKANTKWVEYTAVGIATVASHGTIYDDCCANGCGILARTVDEWLEALEHLVNNDDERVRMIERAQLKLEREYNISQLRDQVFSIIEMSRLKPQIQDNNPLIKEMSFVG